MKQPQIIGFGRAGKHVVVARNLEIRSLDALDDPGINRPLLLLVPQAISINQIAEIDDETGIDSIDASDIHLKLTEVIAFEAGPGVADHHETELLFRKEVPHRQHCGNDHPFAFSFHRRAPEFGNSM